MARSKQSKCCPPHVCSTAKSGGGDIDFAAVAKALGHPLRLEIVAILKKSKTCICGDIVDQLPIAQATVSQHLKVLKKAGIIRGKISGPSTCYCLEPATIKQFKKQVQTLL
ncbi:MAG: ArsR family transcriptional regulator [Deltaproteobacteria bacterium CG_4_10_14_0_2_um_filter_43_8]|nr:MAG: transcriptional regulator [Deltaproteobacteria bacterium CG11_big_fil_rev_8_21_14_0_20_42_23]PJA20111.1 MAG: ArsR family transcriptional regulator [Deltaproteobacteria bacterium CG_4_10_14_0_2_um_filter_43_8]PJC64988.1 MAG: ArsR family transcriptional regulator [Deltaproteobacteria bacterium CG_4_9_14_0_2_um_filter_42_21]